MEYGNVKSFIKAHKKEGGTTIINYSGSTSNADKINAVSISSNAIDTTNLTAKNADIINANILYSKFFPCKKNQNRCLIL